MIAELIHPTRGIDHDQISLLILSTYSISIHYSNSVLVAVAFRSRSPNPVLLLYPALLLLTPFGL
jgi:hypothetical protein